MTGVLLITGGASGIGAETARRAAKRGYKVAINYRSRDAQAMGVAADIAAQDGEAIALPGDMASEADIVRLFNETERAFGRSPIWSTAPASAAQMRVEDYDAAALANLFAINVDRPDAVLPRGGQAHVDQARRQGRRDRQRLVDGGDLGRPAGLVGLCRDQGRGRCLHQGLRPRGRGRGHPGQLDPARHGAERDDRGPAEGRRPSAASIEASIPMHRVGQTHEIADAILWLLSDEASFITGAMLDAAGGGYII